MKNNIKKITAAAMALTLLGTGSAVSQIVSPSACTVITASAANDTRMDIEREWEPVTKKIVTDEGIIIDPKNGKYFKIIVTVDKNNKFGDFCGHIPYNSNKLEVILNNDKKPARTLGEVAYEWMGENNSKNLMFQCSITDKVIGFATIATENCESNGDVITFYAKSKINPIDNKPYTDTTPVGELIGELHMDKVLDVRTNPKEYVAPKEINIISDTPPKNETVLEKKLKYKYKLGDVNGDDTVDVADAQKIINILRVKHKTEVAVSFDFRESADINEDGYIDMKDAEAIFDYYVVGTLCYNKYNPRSDVKHNIGDVVEIYSYKVSSK